MPRKNKGGSKLQNEPNLQNEANFYWLIAGRWRLEAIFQNEANFPLLEAGRWWLLKKEPI